MATSSIRITKICNGAELSSWLKKYLQSIARIVVPISPTNKQCETRE